MTRISQDRMEIASSRHNAELGGDRGSDRNRVPPSWPDRSVCIVGLGYVGLTLAVVMAEAGFEVFGTEIRDDILSRLASAEPHFWERGLADKLRHEMTRGTLRVG